MPAIEDKKARNGSCLCGSVRLVATGEPEGVAACHCDSCRKHTGAPVAVYADYRSDQVAFPGAQPAIFRSSPGVQRGFCATCGSTIFYQGSNLPHMIHLHIGLFDEPASFQPQVEEAVGQRLPWIHVELTPQVA